MVDETCEHDDCPRVLPPFPDTDGKYWCSDHYPEPNDGEFTHLEEIDPEYAEERREMYDE
ncbi:MAG: hypothetical protein ABEJ89_07870 [Haloarculaceae archaeon]